MVMFSVRRGSAGLCGQYSALILHQPGPRKPPVALCGKSIRIVDRIQQIYVALPGQIQELQGSDWCTSARWR